MADRKLYVGDHAITLESGRPVAPGDRIPVSALGEGDQWAVDDELFIDDREIREEAKAEEAKK